MNHTEGIPTHEKAGFEDYNGSGLPPFSCRFDAQAAGLSRSPDAEAMRRPEIAREIIQGSICRVEYELRGLRALMDCLPAKLPQEADAALVRLLQRAGMGL